ncbi:MAG TPA: hypothetical protein VH000_09600 [Rhizomicrobium sp.]|jgi:hypothetical protein|nr:hypothetical protein [Rhizomicrobium sp.]
MPLRKLKVFRATRGFYDTIVAAPSMKAALEAWGAKPNLFKDGVAKEIHDAKLEKIAVEMPRVVFRRIVGSKDEFKPDV